MREIGGYFSLELSKGISNDSYKSMMMLNSSRHALEYVILSLEEKPDKIHLPFYTCEVILEPIERLGIDYEFYNINENLELIAYPELGEREWIIVNNYFGIKDEYIKKLSCIFGDKMIIDNAQGFYYIPDYQVRAIYSPRKFFGVADGGFAKTPDKLEIELESDTSTDRSIHLLRRIDSGAGAGFEEFKVNDSSLSKEPMKAMSSLTRAIISSINYEEIKDRRRRNFSFLHHELYNNNKLEVPSKSLFECPMVYPYLTDDPNLRRRLIDNKIFVATYWPNVFEWCAKDTVEFNLAKQLIPLPIDQRYGKEDMQHILNVIFDGK